MKNFKRTLALVLAVIMVVGMFASVSAAKAKWYANAVRYIESVGIASIGSTAEDKITRDEFVLWVAKLESGTLNDKYWSSAMETPFTDITEDHNQTAIWYAARRSLIEGNGDGTFAPDKNITFAEAAAVIVRLMRYTSKVEGDADDWQWAYMEVANEYCEAFNNEFLDNVGGSVYDYDYELTKGEAAYLLATIMNAPNEIIKGQIDTSNPYKTTYKSLTIDGMNLGERFYERWNGGYGATINAYYVSAIEFDFEDGTIESDNVVLTSVSDGTTKTVSAKDFTKLVRVSLGLAATKADDEDEINVRDTVKLGTLVDATLDKNGKVTAITAHTGSKVVDTHIVMDSMLGVEYGGLGIANWTASSIVSGASNSNVYREAIINGNWSSDLLFTWDGTKLVFEGTKYAFSEENHTLTDDKGTADTSDDVYSKAVKGDLTVFVNNDNVLTQITNTKDDEATVANDKYVLTTAELKAMIPDVATGEVTIIFNDYDLDGKYDSVVINETAKTFDLVFVDNKTVNNKYYSAGYSISDVASGKLNLVVLAEGRFGMKTAFDSDADGKINEQIKDADLTLANAQNNYTKYGTTTTYACVDRAKCTPEAHPEHFTDKGAEMNAYQVFDLATISSGVIEESTLRTFGNNTSYFVVKVKNAAGAYETVYIPAALKNADGVYTVKAPSFKYTINGVEKSYTPTDWVFEEKLEFVTEIPGLLGIKNDAEVGSYADKASKLVGQYISYIVDSSNKAIYCVAGAPAAEDGYVLNVEESDIANMYNVTIATLDDNNSVADVQIYSVNATASVMMAGANYDAIAALFNKGVITANTNVVNGDPDTDIEDVYNTQANRFNIVTGRTDVNDFKASTYIDGTNTPLVAVSVRSNGTFSYLEINDSVNDIDFVKVGSDLLDDEPVVVTKADGSVDTTLTANAAASAVEVTDKDGKKYYKATANTGAAGTAGSDLKAVRTYKGEFYSAPYYYYDDVQDKWFLTVTTETVTVNYEFGVDSTAVTTANYDELADTKLSAVLVKAIDTEKTNWLKVAIDATGKNVLAYADYANVTTDNTLGAVSTADFEGSNIGAHYVVAAEVKADDEGKLYVIYDFRGVDRQAYITTAKKTASITTDAAGTKDYNNNLGFYTFGNAKVDASVYTAEMKYVISRTRGQVNTVVNAAFTSADNVTATITWSKNVVDADSSISNVAFTAMAKTEAGYIPGSYWFTINGVDKVYFNGDTKAAITATEYADRVANAQKVASADVKFRTTVNTEVVLLTPTASGYVVKVMTPAEAAAKDLIISHYSFVMPEQLADANGDLADKANATSSSYNNYNNKVDAIVLVGQEALVATTPEVDDGKDVSEGEYLVYVPYDTETILVAPEGSKTVKVASTKSVYAIPSGVEIGSIFYEYDVYTGAEQPTIKTEIKTGWYVVAEDGEIISTFAMHKQDSTGKNGVYTKKDTIASVKDGKVVGTYYVLNKDGKKTGATEIFDLEAATLLYKDVDGTLKVVADKDAQFASDSIYDLTVKAAYDAVVAAQAAVDASAGYSSAKKAEKKAALAEAIAAYNEALATNIDKFFNGNIWDSFKDTVKKEQNIQGAGEYKLDVYVVDGEVFVILNDWVLTDVNGNGTNDIATVSSNLK